MRSIRAGLLKDHQAMIAMLLVLGTLAISAAFADLPSPAPEPAPAPTPAVVLSQVTAAAAVWSPPLAPADLTVSAGTTDPTTELTLNWTDCSERETGYLIERSLTGGDPWAQAGQSLANATSAVQRGLTPGVIYFYRLRATVRSEVQSAVSNVAHARTAPAPPRITAADFSGTSIASLQWTGQGGAARYNVYRVDEQGNATLVQSQTSNTSFIDRNVSPGLNPSYRIIVTLPDGSSSPATAAPTPARRLLQEFIGTAGRVGAINEWGGFSHTGTLHENVNNLTAIRSRQNHDLWLWAVDGANQQTLAAVVLKIAATDYHAGDVLLKGYLYSGESDAAKAPALGDPFCACRADASQSIQTPVASVDSEGNLKVTEYGAGGPSGLLVWPASNDCRKVTLEWDDTRATSVSLYTFQVERAPSQDFPPTSTTLISRTLSGQLHFACDDDNLSTGTRYYYRVSRVISGRNWKSRPAGVWTLPGRVRFITAFAPADDKVALLWEAPSGASGYQVTRDSTTTFYDPNPFLIDNGLTANHGYCYMVKAVGPGGLSPVSATTSTRTRPSPLITLSLLNDQATTASQPVLATITDALGSRLTTLTLAQAAPATLTVAAGSTVLLEALTPSPSQGQIINGWTLDGNAASRSRFLGFVVGENRNYQAALRVVSFGLSYALPSFETSNLPHWNAAGNQDSSFTVFFNVAPQTISPGVAGDYFSLYGSLNGRLDGLACAGTYDDGVYRERGYYRVQPTDPYRAGETLQVTLKATAQSGVSTATLTRPAVWRYTVRAGDAGQPTVYERTVPFASDSAGTVTCLAAVNLFTTRTLRLSR